MVSLYKVIKIYLEFYMNIFLTAFIFIFLVFGCATPVTQRGEIDEVAVERERDIQEEIALKSLINAQKELSTIAYPIQKQGVDLCGDKVAGFLGAFVLTKDAFAKELQDASSRLYKNDFNPKVITVIPDSPADRAGFKVGDSVLEVAGTSIQGNKNGVASMLEEFRKEVIAKNNVVFKLEREGKTVLAEVEPELACDYPVIVTPGDSINAFADGKQVVITKGMMRFIETDDELALVVGHELAHNTMNHVPKKIRNYWLGAILDILAAGYGVDTQGAFGKMSANAYSEEFEAEADYVGLYFVARAGFDVSEAPTFWRRMAAEHPKGTQDFYGATHPSSPERFVALENTAQEIIEKQETSQTLEPNIQQRTTNPVDEESGPPSGVSGY